METSSTARAPAQDNTGYTTRLHVYVLALNNLWQVGQGTSIHHTRGITAISQQLLWKRVVPDINPTEENPGCLK